MNQWGLLLAGLAITAATTAGCSSSGGDSSGALTGGPTGPTLQTPGSLQPVPMTRVRVFMKDGRLQAYAEGELGDGCMSLQPIKQQRDGNNISLTFTSLRQGDVCTMIMQLINEWVPLDGAFEPGEYAVRANTQQVQFRLVRDGGGLRIDPDPGPPPTRPDFPPASGHVVPNDPKPGDPGSPGQTSPGAPGQTSPAPPTPGAGR